MSKISRINIFISGLLLIISISFFIVYANFYNDFVVFGYEVKKNKELIFPIFTKPKKKIMAKSIIKKTAIVIDTTKKRFLLIGDSQVEGLRNPFYDYCVKNGHKLELAMIWYSSTDMTYGSNDTLKKIIQSYKPNHIVFAIGLNQVYQTYFEGSEKAISKIIEVFDTIPYSWIGPANWVEDRGINNLYKNKIDSGKLYLSKDLILDRAKDGRHPSEKACFIWMDSIANWMQNRSVWKIRMNKPDSLEKTRNFRLITMVVGKK